VESVIRDYWHQIIAIIGLVVVAVKLSASVKELRKDVDDIAKRNTYVETTKLRAQVDMQEKQISALWAYCNKLRDMFTNGKG
tara:strand:+ start:2946 stop:3191 length:246 start_codon:yes stop_codon:yes gene_type:complete